MYFKWVLKTRYIQFPRWTIPMWVPPQWQARVQFSTFLLNVSERLPSRTLLQIKEPLTIQNNPGGTLQYILSASVHLATLLLLLGLCIHSSCIQLELIFSLCTSLTYRDLKASEFGGRICLLWPLAFFCEVQVLHLSSWGRRRLCWWWCLRGQSVSGASATVSVLCYVAQTLWTMPLFTTWEGSYYRQANRTLSEKGRVCVQCVGLYIYSYYCQC